MKIIRALIISGLATALPVWAVYAPIPEQDQGKAWSVSLTAGVSDDSNIFAASSGAIDSVIYMVSPKVSFNESVTDQTFLSASYQLTLDHFDNRPGEQNLDSHDVEARVAHAFTKETTLDVSDAFMINRNPAAALSGLQINTDQSYQSNEANGRFTTSLTPQIGLTLKARSMLYDYYNAKLGTSLDRTENLYGVSGDYAIQPDLKGNFEYRHETINYRDESDNKDKTSDFLLVGEDYNVGEKLTLSSRVGVEYRKRDEERSATSPYIELSTRYAYAQGSFIAAGYLSTFEESSNVLLYTDEHVNRFFVNVQHAVTTLITVSGSVDYEPSRLDGRRGLPNADETTEHVGFAVSYIPTKNWLISGTYDYDNDTSDDQTRQYTRNRYGVNATYSF
jgi:hypothetical protein